MSRQTLRERIPTSTWLLNATVPELGLHLLALALQYGTAFDENDLNYLHVGAGLSHAQFAPYGEAVDAEVQSALSEGWAWLQSQGYVAPAQSASAWLRVTRLGESLRSALKP